MHTFEFWQPPDEADEAPEQFATDVPLGEKQAETKEDIFTRQQKVLEEALGETRAQRESFRSGMRRKIEEYRPRKERKEELKAERMAQREQQEQAALERREEAQRLARERTGKPTEATEGNGTKVSDFVAERSKREQAAQAKSGGAEKSYTQRHRAVYFIERVSDIVYERYDKMQDAIIEMQERIKEIDRQTKTLSDEARSARHDFGEQVRVAKREQTGSTSDLTREITKHRSDLFKQGTEIRTKTQRLRSEHANLQARINTKKSELIRFKRLVDQVKRIYDNRNSKLTDPFAELQHLHDELRRWHITLPNLRLAA
ncbi:MAG: hypothetical protein V1895_02200 [Parcubacteria group bacterium]